MDKTCPNQCLERDRTFWDDCLGLMNGAVSGAIHCGKTTTPSSGLGSPLHPPRAPRGHVGTPPPQRSPPAGRGEGGKGPPAAGVNVVLPPTLLRIARPRAPSQGRGGGAKPAAPLPPGVCTEAGKLSEGATSSPGQAGGDVRYREGGVKAGKSQPQPPACCKTAI